MLTLWFIVQVTATDKDRGANGQVTYGIVSPASGVFVIDPKTGHITVGKDIDRERPGETEKKEKYIQV